MNLKIKQFEQRLIELINDSELPAEAVRLIILNTYHEVERIAEEAVQKELQEVTEEEKKDAEST